LSRSSGSGSGSGSGAGAQAPSRSFLGALLLATALGPISLQMFLPALPAIQEAFSVSAGVAQLALSLSMVSIAFATLGYGPLSDRFGRRPVLVAGQLLFVAGSAACIVAPGIASLVAATGCSMGAPSPRSTGGVDAMAPVRG